MAQAAVRGRHQGYAYINKNPKKNPIRVTHIHLKNPAFLLRDLTPDFHPHTLFK